MALPGGGREGRTRGTGESEPSASPTLLSCFPYLYLLTTALPILLLSPVN